MVMELWLDIDRMVDNTVIPGMFVFGVLMLLDLVMNLTVEETVAEAEAVQVVFHLVVVVEERSMDN